MIIKLFTTGLSVEEMERFKLWLQKPKNHEKFKAFVKANEDLDLIHLNLDEMAAYQNIMKGISEHQKTERKLYQVVMRYAAVIVVLFGIGYGIYDLTIENEMITGSIVEADPEITLELEDGSIVVLDENNEGTIKDKEGNDTASQLYDNLVYRSKDETDTKLVFNELTVPYGKRFKVSLSDGTNVFLNAGTKLRYPKEFGNTGKREVFLEGEAYFNVTPSTRQPFIVNTEDMNVQVLGTRFNVSSYKNENNTSATLVEGSVAVYESDGDFDPHDSILIAPGQQASYEDGIFAVNEVNVSKHIAWTQGKLYFEDDRFENIVKELERHYNISITNNFTQLNKVRYYGTFDHETIIQVLNTFKKNTNFDYKINGRNILITKN